MAGDGQGVASWFFPDLQPARRSDQQPRPYPAARRRGRPGRTILVLPDLQPALASIGGHLLLRASVAKSPK
ncbi:hypothetical protein ABE38_24385 [Brevibacillus agri]|nr:hypothetical protein [Brevibacillus agri]